MSTKSRRVRSKQQLKQTVTQWQPNKTKPMRKRRKKLKSKKKAQNVTKWWDVT